jgi:predicted nucleic acid-binding protein
MPFVLDSSVALSWVLPDEQPSRVDALCDRLIEEPAVVPAIWVLEVGNVLLTAARRERISRSELDRLSALLSGLPIETDTDGIAPGLDQVLTIARDNALTTYDAAYLELAQRRSLPLATLDRRLSRVARNMRIQLLP